MTSTITGTPSSQPKKYLPIAILLGNGCMQDRRSHARAAWQYPDARTVVCVESTHERVRPRQRKHRNFNASCQEAMYRRPGRAVIGRSESGPRHFAALIRGDGHPGVQRGSGRLGHGTRVILRHGRVSVLPVAEGSTAIPVGVLRARPPCSPTLLAL